MKKKFLLVTLVSLLTVMVVSSCDKDDDNGNSLVGTQWVYEEDEWSLTFKFTTATKGICVESEEGDEDETESFTYTYENPNITIDVWDETIEGVIDGNKMTLMEDDEAMIFTKK